MVAAGLALVLALGVSLGSAMLYLKSHEVFVVSGESMAPYFTSGELVSLERRAEPQVGDIVVFHHPPAWTSQEDLFVKRIIAKGGDLITYDGAMLSVNGSPMQALGSQYPCSLSPSFSRRLAPGSLLVRGDNVPRSSDSLRMACEGKVDTMAVPTSAVIVQGPVAFKFKFTP